QNHRHDQTTVSIDELVPRDHFLRTVDELIDFSFIERITTPYYCTDNGRPSIAPVTLFKMLFLGYLYGIRSERQLEKEIQANIAYRWFLGYSLVDRVPDHSTISFNRKGRFEDTSVFEEIFDETVRQAQAEGFVSGRVLLSDSTHVKANANKNKFLRVAKTEKVVRYLGELEQAVQQDRAAHGKKPLKPKATRPTLHKKASLTRVSKTDPDSGFLMRDHKPQGFFYLDHRTVDAKYNFITDTFITPGNVHDTDPYLERLKHQTNRFSFPVEAIALDAGYFTGHICMTLQKAGIFVVMGYRRFKSRNTGIPKGRFTYVESMDAYACPMGCKLAYATTDRSGYRHYKSRRQDCMNCPLRSDCFSANATQRTVTRHIWESYKRQVRDQTNTISGKKLYRLRSQTIERSFADAKELHGFRYARRRGHRSVQEQAYLTAATQNIKKMALLLSKRA
ncbi:MAG: IS1182 family transposase, partial [Planococcus sp. (in: firmicutes)]|nr:IS1182 family transposase [Planococcus sp. (in: firmicutes)]